MTRLSGVFERAPSVPADAGGTSRGFALHLFPAPSPGSADRGFRSYAATRRDRLTEASSRTASAAPIAPPASTPAAPAIPPAVDPVLALPTTPPAPVPAPAFEAKPMETAAAGGREKPSVPDKPAPSGAVVFASGVLIAAPAAQNIASEVQVAEIEAPVALAPRSAGTKPAPARSDPGAKRRAVEAAPLPATPLIPPADLLGSPPPVREPLSLDTTFAPLAPGGADGAGMLNSAVADAGAPAAGPTPAARTGSAETSLLAARAATPPAAEPDKESVASERVVFEANVSDLPSGAEHQLDAIVTAASRAPQSHVRLIAYASGNADDGNQARRLSLSRALAVRAYLIQEGIASGRLEVRALGNRSEGGPGDRVDLRVGGP